MATSPTTVQRPKPAKPWPAFVSSSRWSTLYDALMLAGFRRLDRYPGPPGPPVPRLINADLITLTMGLYAAAGGLRFPSWYQWAALAYGWGVGTKPDQLDTTRRQASRLVPRDIADAFWEHVYYVLNRLESDNEPNPRIDLDGSFMDVVFQGEVRAALQSDGAEANWKIPLPACKDPKTGKPGIPRRDPATGKLVCDPVLIDDPITAIGKALSPLAVVALIVGAFLLFRD